MKKTIFAVAATAALLTGCGGDNSASSPSTTATLEQSASAHNKQDISFVQQMIPHHRQAVTMSDLAAKQASSNEVRSLAARIRAAQQPEIDKMQGWLTAWGAAGEDSHSGHDSGAMDDSKSAGHGMMTDRQMQDLEKSRGADFDRMFLTMMVEHHKGAIAMADDQSKKGQNSDAKAMATDIRDSQQKEVSEMQGLLSAR